jgi:adenylate cyclase
VRIGIGIHLGDMVRSEGDVHGDGVNIAARLEPLAEPGGICISNSVHDQIENKVSHTLVWLSRPELKNIQASGQVYKVVLAGATQFFRQQWEPFSGVPTFFFRFRAKV